MDRWARPTTKIIRCQARYERSYPMKTYTVAIVAGVAGVVCGLVSHTSLLEGRWFNLVLWAIAGIALGWLVQGRAQIVWVGILYGFMMTATFLLSGFQGTAGNLPAFLVLTLALSVVGALGGLAAVFIGSRLRRLVR